MERNHLRSTQFNVSFACVCGCMRDVCETKEFVKFATVARYCARETLSHTRVRQCDAEHEGNFGAKFESSRALEKKEIYETAIGFTSLSKRACRALSNESARLTAI